MKSKPGILTSRMIDHKEWIKNTTSIYELSCFSEISGLPDFIKKHLINLYRYLNKFDLIIGTRLFINRKKFDIIISASANQAVTFSFLSFFFGRKKHLHILAELYLQAPIRFKTKIRPFIYKIFLTNVDYIIVSSSSEIENYSKLLNIDKNRFLFLPYPTTVMNPEIIDYEEDYILSAGKQFRDYSTLIKAIRGTGCKLIIVSNFYSMKDVEICEEATILYNISKKQYLDLLLKSKFVVVPLGNDFTSCGQIAILEGMSYGKPVITAKVVGTLDYIEDGKTGLFYEKGNSEDLRKKIILLAENRELREKLAHQALHAVNTTFNLEVFVTQYLQFINEKWQRMPD